MIRIISVAFVLALASLDSTQAMPLAAIQQPDSTVKSSPGAEWA